MKNENLLKEFLLQNCLKIETALISLKKSLSKCQKIELTQALSFDDSEAFDSLSSKFGRLSDIYIQKILRTIFILFREEAKHIVDLANKAEKFEIIDHADTLIMIRDIRNQITHEYEDENLLKLYQEILQLSELLILNIENTIIYIRRTDSLQPKY